MTAIYTYFWKWAIWINICHKLLKCEKICIFLIHSIIKYEEVVIGSFCMSVPGILLIYRCNMKNCHASHCPIISQLCEILSNHIISCITLPTLILSAAWWIVMHTIVQSYHSSLKYYPIILPHVFHYLVR